MQIANRTKWIGYRALGTCAAGLVLSALASSAQDVQSYARATAGATVRNFQDKQGKPVLQLEEGQLLQVHSESVGFLEVSAPKGFRVWVFGEFLAPTGSEDILTVRGSGVRMRPLPSSSVDSYPLGTKLSSGDLVQFIERADPETAFEQDWVQVWSTPQARGWVLASQVIQELDVSGAAKEWESKLRTLEHVPFQKPASVTSITPVAAAQDAAATPAPPKIPQEAYRSLAYGKTLLNNALEKGRAAGQVDFEKPIDAFEIVLKMAPEGTIVSQDAAEKLKEARTHQTLAAVREELRNAEARQAEMLRIWREEQRMKELERTPHWGRFSGRGWVEEIAMGVETHYFLRWGGEIVFELSCMSGRYDLSLFEGYEVGVRATTMRERTMGAEGAGDEPALLDVSKIEVISGSARR